MIIFYYTIIVSCLLLSVPGSDAAEKIKVATIFGKTGQSAISNKEIVKGARLAVQELNRKGGIRGRLIELLEFDNRSSALYAKLAAEKAVKAGVIAVFGANWSSHSLAMAPVFQSAKIPMITPTSTNPQVTLVGDYIFRACYIDSFQGMVMADFAFQDLGAETAVIFVNANSRYSEGLAVFFHQRFKKRGGKIVMEAVYLQDTDDFSSYLEKVKLLKPDIVFIPGHNDESAWIIKQAGEKGLQATFLGGDGWDNTMYDIAGSALHGHFYSGHWHKDIKNDNSRRFLKTYQKKYGELKGGSAALVYDAVFLFADAVRRAGSIEPVKIRDAIAATRNFNGVTGNITFNEHGDPIKPAVILKFDKGTSVYIKTIKP